MIFEGLIRHFLKVNPPFIDWFDEIFGLKPGDFFAFYPLAQAGNLRSLGQTNSSFRSCPEKQKSPVATTTPLGMPFAGTPVCSRF